eukprot:scaffold6895_cov290-Prasinococcus_capsulatus_cf.AAC.2
MEPTHGTGPLQRRRRCPSHVHASSASSPPCGPARPLHAAPRRPATPRDATRRGAMRCDAMPRRRSLGCVAPLAQGPMRGHEWA